MVETLNYTETEKTPEYNEQSPDALIDSLTIFDSYVPVPEGKKRHPEQQMPFNSQEQELAKGIRGTLEEMAARAKEDGRTVSIPELFAAFDDMLRESDTDDETKDQLFLVAEKMHYHLQLRYDKAQNGEPRPEPIPMTDPLIDAMLHNSDFLRSYTKVFLDNSLRDAKLQAEPKQQEWKDWVDSRRDKIGNDTLGTQTESEPVRNYDVEARNIIAERTEGADFNTLDKKLQGKLTRGLARDYHPDRGGDEELYKAITEQTDVKPTDSPDSDTRSY